MNTLLIVHIIGGTIGLLSGTFIVLSKKGNSVHKKSGKLFTYSMSLSMMAAFPISYIKENIFLFCIGIFTIYMIITGNRALSHKINQKVKILDYTITVIMVLFGLVLMIYGIYKGGQMLVISAVFSFISLFFVWNDYRFYFGKMNLQNPGLTIHIQRMTGAYIAAFTAFLVVNNTILPGVIGWLLPTFIFVPLIIYWSRKRKVRL